MPVDKISDAPANIRKLNGVALTLEQVNWILELYDTLTAEGKVSNAMAVAIAAFKKAFELRNGKWVRRKQKHDMREDKAMLELAQWTTKYVNDLPDSSFLYIAPGGKKDESGKTVPRSLRYFPYKDANGKIDLPHVRNAIARIPQSNAKGLTAAKKKALQEKLRKILDAENKKRMGKFVLADTGLAGEVQPISGLWTDENGVPRRRYVKDMIRVGKYKHPRDGWELDVTVEKIDEWIEKFRQMKAAGVDVEIAKDHSMKADDVVGYVVDMYREGDTLYGVHEMRGSDAIDLAARVKNVSVLIDRDYVDGKGNKYGEVIVHSALVQQPVVPGQSDFKAIAASRSGGEVQEVPMLLSGDFEMANSDEVLEKLRELAGLDEGDEQVVMSKLTEMISELKTAKEAAEAKIKELESSNAELIAASKAANEQVDPDVLEERAETAEEKLQSLVEKAKITPAVAKKLQAALIGDSGARNAYALTRKASGMDVPLAKQILEALKENDPVELGEKTKAQSVALARQVPGEEKVEIDPEDIKRRAKEALLAAGIRAKL